jgi:zinc D-Ala-D-Ala carboxypeptidase
MSTYLTEHFSLEEVTHSETASRFGISNILPEALLPVVLLTAKRMERIRAFLGTPISITSWYRCPELNSQLGSRLTSQHIKGEAVDFISPACGDPLVICKKIIAFPELIKFDQLILEHTWVHISFSADPTRPDKGEVLSLIHDGQYAKGLTNRDGVPI